MVTILCLNINDIAIITVIGFENYCIIHNANRSGAIYLLKDYVLDERGYI